MATLPQPTPQTRGRTLFSAELAFCLLTACVVGTLGTGWLAQPASGGELTGHAAKVVYFLHLLQSTGTIPGWIPDYLTGHPSASLLSFALAFPVYLPALGLFEPVTAFKVTGLALLAAGGAGAFLFGRRLARSSWTGFAIGTLYLLAPQLLLRLGWQEHMTIVICYPLVPLAFWSLLRIADRGTLYDAVLFATIYAATLLAWSKMGATLAVPLGLFAVWLFTNRPAARPFLLRALVVVVPGLTLLAVLALIPLLRERAHMAVFELDPFAAWQAQYSIKAATSWLDRGGELFRSLPATLRIDHGAYYLGALSLAAVIATIVLHWRPPSANSARQQPLTPSQLATFRAFLGIFLVIHWISFGPRSVWLGHLELLAGAMRFPDAAIPLHWLALAAPIVAIWWLTHPLTPNRLPPRVVHVPFAIFASVYFFVPGFRLLEFLPLYQDLRAPDSFWILNAPLAWAVCAGTAASGLIALIRRLPLRALAGAAAVAFTIWDASLSARPFFQSDLTTTNAENFTEVTDHLRSGSGRILTVSGRYFPLNLPVTAGRPLASEALNRYLMPRHASRVNVAARLSATHLVQYLNLAGVTDILLDKNDPSIPPNYDGLLRTLYPTTFENDDFAVLHNAAALYPAFTAATSGTVAEPDDLSAAPVALEVSRRNQLTVPATEATTSEPTADSPMLTPTDLPSASVTTPSWLVLSTSWHPDWTATVNGQPTPVHRVAGGFPGVLLPTGTHEVQFGFQPPWYYAASAASSAAAWVAALAFLAIAPFVRAKSKSTLHPPSFPLLPISRPVVLIPTYNEATGLASLLDEITARTPHASILVIDDASPDGTADLTRRHPEFGKRLHLLARPRKLGLGSAYRDGFQWALDQGHDAIVQIDADHSHDPADIPELLAALDAGADTAIGSRYLDGTRVINWPRHRLALSTTASLLARSLTGLPLTDATSGFKAIRLAALETLPWRKTLHADGYGFQIELHWLIWQNALVLREIPITFTERRAGQTKMTPGIALEAAWLLVKLALRTPPASEVPSR